MIECVVYAGLAAAYTLLTIVLVRFWPRWHNANIADESSQNPLMFGGNLWPEVRTVRSSDQAPHPRSGHKAVATATDLFTWGGYCPLPDVLLVTDPPSSESPVTFPELWRYNYATSSWTSCLYTGEAPTMTVASCAACLHYDKMYVYGGTGYPFGQNVSHDIHVCHLDKLHWTKLEIKGDPLPKSYGSSVAVIDRSLYILFGTDGFGFHSQVHRVNLDTLICEKLCHSLQGNEFGEDTSGRYRQEIAVFDKKIYVFGGGSHNGVCLPLDEIPVFDTETMSWDFLKTKPDKKHGYPLARKFHSAVIWRRDVYLFGGVYVDVDSEDEMDELIVDRYLWRYSVDTNQWRRTRSRLQWKSYFQAAAVSPTGQMFVQGGVISSSRSNRRTSLLFTVWLEPPKLFDFLVFQLGQYNQTRQHSATDPRRRKLRLPRYLEARLTPNEDTALDSDDPESTTTSCKRPMSPG